MEQQAIEGVAILEARSRQSWRVLHQGSRGSSDGKWVRQLAILLSVLYFIFSPPLTGQVRCEETTIFDTAGHPKANGLKMRVKLPGAWKSKEGERPNVVQKFVRGEGYDTEVAMILVVKLQESSDPPFSEQELTDFLSEEGLSTLMPEGAKVIETKRTKIEGLPAGILEFEQVLERAGLEIPQRQRAIYFVEGNNLIQIAYQVGGASTAELEQRMTTGRTVFLSIANSVVLPDRWSNDGTKSTPASPPSSPPPSVTSTTGSSEVPLTMKIYQSDGAKGLSVYFLLSFAMTYSIGLIPPIVLRFAIAKRPLKRKSAILAAGGYSLACWLAFRVIHSLVESHARPTAAWFIVFFISVWILTWGSSKNKPQLSEAAS